MGLGHVPARSLRQERASVDVPRRQHRRAGADDDDLIDVGAAHRRRVGVLGEHIAAAFLRGRGVRITGRNVEVARGEIDIVAEDQAGRFVVEVKTVTPAAGRAGSEVVDETKLSQVWRLARLLDPPAHRVDVVEVLLDATGARVRRIRSM